jgi:hypothetical protein
MVLILLEITMNVLLAHLGFEPVFYGIVLALGFTILYIKWTLGWIKSFILDIVMFSIVFYLHGGSMTGGMAAAVCALVLSITFPLIPRLFRR